MKKIAVILFVVSAALAGCHKKSASTTPKGGDMGSGSATAPAGGEGGGSAAGSGGM